MNFVEFREALADLNLSQVAAAPALGVDARTVRRWASGETPVPKTVEILTLKYLADMYPSEELDHTPEVRGVSPIGEALREAWFALDDSTFANRCAELLTAAIPPMLEEWPANALWASRVLAVSEGYGAKTSESVLDIMTANLNTMIGAGPAQAEVQKALFDQIFGPA